MAEFIGTPKKALALKKKMDTELRVFIDNVATWSETNPDAWVAIDGSNVIAIDPDRDRLLERVRARGLDPAHVLLQFIPRPGTVQML
jgi:hypothetical protein